jgi:hypothetical protein
VPPVSGWYPDPTGRFEYRFHNGQQWTADVAANGQRYVDPLPPPPPGVPAGAPPVPPGAAQAPTGGRGNGMAVAAMVCGIVAVATSWIPLFGILGLISGIVGLALGITALGRSRRTGQRRGQAIAGIVTGSVGIALGIAGLVLTVVLFRAVQRFDDPGPVTATLTSCSEDDGFLVAEGELENLSGTTRDYSVLVQLGRGKRDRVEMDGPVPFGLDPDLFLD